MTQPTANLQSVLIHHPRRPYKVRAYVRHERPEFAIVRLNKRSQCRVLHIASGLTMADAESLHIAREFVGGMGYMFNRYPEVEEAFSTLSWDNFKDHIVGIAKHDDVSLVIKTVCRYTIKLGYLNSDATTDCRYKYPPEYIS